MSLSAELIRCPSCGANHEEPVEGQNLCEYCLAVFTLQGAQEEANRLEDSARTWVGNQLGQSRQGESNGTVDPSTRSYLFRQSLLPPLRREVDRALERFGGFERFPVVSGLPGRASDGEGSPLVAGRDKVLELRALRARLGSDEIRDFAVTEADQAELAALDAQVASVLALSNASVGASTGSADGYEASMRSLEQAQESLALMQIADGAVADFASERLACVHDIIQAYARATTPGGVSESVAEAARGAVRRLEAAIERLEGQASTSVEATLMVMAARGEIAAATELVGWLESYEKSGVAGMAGEGLGFVEFLSLAEGRAEAFSVPKEHRREWLDSVLTIRAASRGETVISNVSEFEWVQPWVEKDRKGKFLGFLGSAESIGTVERFYVPAWVVALGGKHVVVNACRRDGALAGKGSLPPAVAKALERPQPVSVPQPVALPALSAVQALARVRGHFAADAQSGSVSGLVLLPAASADLSKGGQTRTIASSLFDMVEVGAPEARCRTAWKEFFSALD